MAISVSYCSNGSQWELLKCSFSMYIVGRLYVLLTATGRLLKARCSFISRQDRVYFASFCKPCIMFVLYPCAKRIRGLEMRFQEPQNDTDITTSLKMNSKLCRLLENACRGDGFPSDMRYRRNYTKKLAAQIMKLWRILLYFSINKLQNLLEKVYTKKLRYGCSNYHNVC